MRCAVRPLYLALFISASLPACKRLGNELSTLGEKVSRKIEAGQYKGADRVRAEVDAYRYKIRGYYNNRNFKALESAMLEIRNGAPLFGDGSWPLYQFYSSLRCADRESEGMWQLHDRIHNEWIKAYPSSITARVAHADFFVEYAWHARGSGFANTVTQEGWRLHRQRLATAQQMLTACKSMQPTCPMWWEVQATIAMGLGWNQGDYGRVFNEAKSVAPQFFYIDQSLATYLLPRWHGRAGDWERAAEAEIHRPNGLKEEGYARVVACLRRYYGNIFQESRASWPSTRAGFEILIKKYPGALSVLTAYCECACLAQDRALAQQLFNKLNGYVDEEAWGGAERYRKLHDWALR